MSCVWVTWGLLVFGAVFVSFYLIAVFWFGLVFWLGLFDCYCGAVGICLVVGIVFVGSADSCGLVCVSCVAVVFDFVSCVA